MSLTGVVLTRNEEKNIAACIANLTVCDEILIIDDESIDNTVALAKKHGARVIRRTLKNFSNQRNFALENAKGEWVLFVDADERISSALQHEIKQKISTPEAGTSGYYIKRQDIIWGKELKYGETSKVRLLRLAKKNSGKWVGNVHEEWKIEGRAILLKHHLVHYPHQTLSEFLQEINQYTNFRAKELYEQGTKVSFLQIVAYPKAKFLYNYLLNLGFLDGVPGFMHAAMMSFHSFLVRGKLWLLWQRKLPS